MFQTTHQIGLFLRYHTLYSSYLRLCNSRLPDFTIQLEPKIAVATSTVDFWATPFFLKNILLEMYWQILEVFCHCTMIFSLPHH